MPFNANNPFAPDRHYCDADVVRAFLSDNRPVMKWWYDKCRTECLRAASSYNYIIEDERNDLLQETFLLVWDKISMGLIYVRDNEVFVVRKGVATPCSNFMGYVINTLRYKYLEMMRSSTRIVPVDDMLATLPGRPELISELYSSPDREVMKDLLVAKAMGDLAKSCQTILYKFHFEGKNYEQILAEMPSRHSVAALKQSKSKCLATLKKMVAELYKKAGV